MNEEQTERFKELMSDVVYNATFIPQSQSRNRKEKRPIVNWRISLIGRGQAIDSEYSAGIGCLSERDKKMVRRFVGNSSHPGRKLIDQARIESKIAETGAICNLCSTVGMKIVDRPDLKDIIHSLLSDSEAIDSGSFEEWASNYGYDTDSRSAEKTYQACVEIGLKMRAMFGNVVLTELLELFQDY